MNVTLDKPEVVRTLIGGLDPFQVECLVTIGHYCGISYAEILQLRPTLALQTLYQARQTGKLIPHNSNTSKIGFSWDAVKRYFESMGLA